MANSDPPIDVEKGKLKLGFKTQLMLIGAVIVATTWAVTTYAGIATKQNVVEALKERKQHPETSTRLKTLETSNIRHSEDIAALKVAVKKIDNVSAKVDFLTQQAIIEAQNSATKRKSVERAAKRVRRAAQKQGNDDDPLADVEGL